MLLKVAGLEQSHRCRTTSLADPHQAGTALFRSRRRPCAHTSRVKARSQSATAPDVSLQSLAGAAGGALSKLQRYVQPPPTGFPSGPTGDQSVSMLQGPLEFITRLRRDYGTVVGMLLGGECVVLISDPAAARQILVEQPDVFVKAGTAFFPGSSLTGNGLLVSDGDVWRRQRRMANPAFRKTAVDKYAEEMVTAAQDLLDGPFAAAADNNSSRSPSASAAGGVGVRDVYADFNQLTLNITLAALFGIRTEGSSSSSSSNTAARVVSAVEKAFTYFAARGATAMVVPEWVPTPDNVAFKEAVQQLDDLVYGIIDSRRADMQRQQQQDSAAGVKTQSDLLQALLDSTDDSGQPMARSALRDELMTLLVAGQETSAILLGWAAALLAHNPKIQAAAAAEVQQALGATLAAAANSSSSSSSSSTSFPTLSPGDISKLPFITAVVLESLRLYSPAYMVGRCACKDVDLVTGHHLPLGTTVLVSPYLLHREPNRWKQPGVYNPERWLPLLTAGAQQQQQQQQQQLEGDTTAASSSCPVDHSSSSSSSSDGCPVQHEAGTTASNSSSSNSSSSSYGFMSVLRDLGPNGAYIPFGGGPRNCIGTGFAMMEAVLVLAMLLQRYELQPQTAAAGFPRPKPMLTLRPEAVPLRVLRRASC